jgi:transposase
VSIPVPSTPRSEAEQILDLQRRLTWAELKIQALEAELRLERIKKYGPASEKLTSAQLALLEQEPGVSQVEVAAESERPPLPPAEEKPARSAPSPTALEKRHHPGRQSLPAHLPRVERVIACAPEQCACAHCGQPTQVIGYDTSEQLDVEPAKYFVLVTKREKRGCASCARGVTTAPAPARIIEKGLASDRVVIDTVVAKYADHVPLYRQSAMLARDAEVEIRRATMTGWVMRVGELLTPLVERMRRELLAGSYLQADETPVDVQTQEGRGKNHQAYLWQYGAPEKSVVFDFQLGRGREGPKQFLSGFSGILQTDGYAAYERVGGAGMVHAACWTHARRKFVDALKLNASDAEVAQMVARIDALFGIDAEARARGLDQAGRLALRQEQARPVLAALRQELERVRRQALPSSVLGKAAQYTLSLWPKLIRFLEYAELELSNNLAENAMRGVAVGRKNWIHIGSAQAGPRVAAILSVVESCRRLRIPVRDYLGEVLPGLASRTLPQLVQLTPVSWAARHR